MPNLDDAFFPALWQLAHDTGAPSEFFLNFLYMESTLNPAVPPNPKHPDYHGLNQMNGPYLRDLGIDPQDYRTWSASKQLTTVVAPFLKSQVRLSGYTNRIPTTPDGNAILYALNFLPGQLKKRGSAPDSVLAAKNATDAKERGYYAANSGLDYDKQGAITIRGMARRLANKWHDGSLQAELKRLYAAGPVGYKPPYDMINTMPPKIDVVLPDAPKSNVMAWIVGGFAAGIAGAWLWKRH